MTESWQFKNNASKLYLTLFDPERGWGELLKPHMPPNFCPHTFNFGSTLFSIGAIPPKQNSHRVAKNILLEGQDLATRGKSKFVDEIFIVFRKFNIMLETVYPYTCSFTIRHNNVKK